MAFGSMNYLAIVVAAITAWLFGALYYGVFGKQWLAAIGRTQEDMTMKRGTFAFYLPFIVSFIAEILMAWILAGAIGHLGPGQATIRNGMISGAILWTGFVLTTMLVNNMYAGRKLKLSLIDGTHWLCVLLIMVAVIGAFGGR